MVSGAQQEGACFPAPDAPIGRFLSVCGVQAHVHEQGAADAPPVLLLHSASANLREFAFSLAPRIAAFARSVSVDRPGLGFSGRPRGAERLGVQAAFAAAVLERTVRAPAVIVGHSFGGAVALRLALERPELVRALVLFAPASRPWPGRTAWYNRLAARPLIGPAFAQAVRVVGPMQADGALANTFRPQPAPQTYGAELGAALLFRPHSFRANARDLAFLNAELQAQAPRYDQIRAPVRVLFGDSDHVVTYKRHGLALAQAVRDGRAHILPGVGHMPHRAAPEAALEMIRTAVET